MAKQTINVGTVPNDETGDTFRASFIKCNDNFDELYALDAADLTSGSATDGHVLTADGSGGAAWEAAAGGDLVNDTTPQLGGNLDLNGKRITGSGGTVTTSQPIIDVSQTWNNAGVIFTGINVNITNTASSIYSNLFDLKVNGSSLLFVRPTTFYYYGSINTGNCAILYNTACFLAGYRGSYAWASGNAGSTPDCFLTSDAANVIAQRNSTNAQTYRLYNTWTDASNYERLSLKWESNVCIITTAAQGTGTLRGLKIGEAATSLVGFYGVTPVVQQASADQAVVTLGNANSEISDLTFSASPTQAECQALRDKCEELADDVRALSTLVHSLRTALLNTGLIKGAA